MKKSTLLSFVTAGAIVATSVGTYAVWDQIDATATNKLTVEKPTAVNALMPKEFATTTTDLSTDAAPTYTADVSFTVDAENKANTLTLSTEILNSGTDVTNQFDVSYEEKSGTGLTGNVDSVIDANGAKDANSYTVKITPKDSTTTTAVGTELTVNVKGTISKSAS